VLEALVGLAEKEAAEEELGAKVALDQVELEAKVVLEVLVLGRGARSCNRRFHCTLS